MARALLLVFALASSASAQWTNYDTFRSFNNPMSSYLDSVITGNLRMKAMAERFAGAHDQPSSVVDAVPPTFNPRPGRLLIGDLADAITDDADLRTQLSEALELGLQAYEAFAFDQGRPHDVGLALTFFVVVNYLLATYDQPPDEGVDALLVAVDAALAADESFLAADDVERQSLYETLVGLAVFAMLSHEAGVASEDPEMVEASRAIAASFLEAVLGSDIERISLDASGLVLH
jgi:hypothetical protein